MDFEEIQQRARQAALEQKQKQEQEEQKEKEKAVADKTESIYAARNEQIRLNDENKTTQTAINERNSAAETQKKEIDAQRKADFTELQEARRRLGINNAELKRAPEIEEEIRNYNLAQEQLKTLLEDLRDKTDSLANDNAALEEKTLPLQSSIDAADQRISEIGRAAMEGNAAARAETYPRTEQINKINKEAREVMAIGDSAILKRYIQYQNLAHKLADRSKSDFAIENIIQHAARNLKHPGAAQNNDELWDLMHDPETYKIFQSAAHQYFMAHNLGPLQPYEFNRIELENPDDREKRQSLDKITPDDREKAAIKFKAALAGLSDEEKTQISEAINKTNLSEKDLFNLVESMRKSDPEVFEKVYSNAKTEDTEVDITREIAKSHHEINRLELANQQSLRETAIEDLAVNYKNSDFESVSLARDTDDKIRSMQREIVSTEEDINRRRNNKFFGVIKNKTGLAEAEARLKTLKNELDDYTSERETVQADKMAEKGALWSTLNQKLAGQNVTVDQYLRGFRPRARMSIKINQDKIQELQKRIAALEIKQK